MVSYERVGAIGTCNGEVGQKVCLLGGNTCMDGYWDKGTENVGVGWDERDT